jgi:hypothetical protein
MRLANGSGWTGISTTKSLGIGMTPSNVLDITQSANAASKISLLNATSGTAGRSQISLAAGTASFDIYNFSQGYTTSGLAVASGSWLRASGQMSLSTDGASPIVFSTNGTERARIDSSGNLGIGTTPACTLNIYGANTAARGQLSIDSSGTDSRLTWYTSGTFRASLSVNATTISFDPQNNQSYIFPGAGGLLLNTTSAISIDQNECAFPGSTKNGFGFNDTTASAGCNILVFRSNGTAIGTISNNSNTGVLYNVTSDKELKDFVGVHDNGDILDRVEWNDFTWKSHPDNGIKVGAFAQDIYKVVPDVVTPGRGAIGEEDFIPWQVDYTGLVPYLGAEVKSLRARVATLEARLAALENK